METMLDIESLGTDENSVIASIAAVKFDLTKRQSPREILDRNPTFSEHIAISDQVKRGRLIDPATVLWWLEQDEKARMAFITGQKTARKPAEVLMTFDLFLRDSENVWGNGNMFDNALVKSLFEMFYPPYPIKFSKDLDFRTLKYLFKKRFPGEDLPYPPLDAGQKETAHIGIIDAARQASAAQIIYAKLNGEFVIYD